MTKRAVILAAGLGTRMRRAAPGVALTAEQKRAAEAGVKALIPIAGRPFLDHQLEALDAAGVDDLCVVVGVEHDSLVDHCLALAAAGRAVTTAVQHRPLGTADALRAAEEFAGDEPFLMLNSDNFYAAGDLTALAGLGGPGLLALERRRALAAGLSEDKLRAWAVVRSDDRGCLDRLIEKPDATTWRALADPVLLSTNAWRFEPDVFDACRRVSPSPRGELELPAAVLESIERRPARCYRLLEAVEPVLDLSERADIPLLEARWRAAGAAAGAHP